MTVGNRPDRLGGVTVVPASGTSVAGRVGIGLDVGGGAGEELFDPTDVVTAAPAGESDAAVTVIEKVMAAPGVALALTLSATLSSMA